MSSDIALKSLIYLIPCNPASYVKALVVSSFFTVHLEEQLPTKHRFGKLGNMITHYAKQNLFQTKN